jgi:heptosyltransferase-3
LAKTPKRILVILFPVLGDVLLGTPLIRALRLGYPDARIDVLVHVGCRVVLQGNPDLDEVIEIDRRPKLGDYIALARRILWRYDLAVTIPLSDRASLYARAAAKRVVTWVDPGKRYYGMIRRLYSEWGERATGPTHPLQANAYVAELLGLPYDGQVVAPREPDAADRVGELLEHTVGPVAILHPGTRMPYKQWHESGWQAVARELQSRGYALVVTGGKAEEELAYIDHLFGEFENLTVAAGRLRFGDIGELMTRAELFVGVDTSITHLAAAAGTPTVVLFGPEDPRVWGPWPAQRGEFSAPLYLSRGDCHADNVAVVHSSLPCVPCRRSGCDDHPNSHSECIDEIQPVRVLRALAQVMRPQQQRASSPTEAN